MSFLLFLSSKLFPLYFDSTSLKLERFKVQESEGIKESMVSRKKFNSRIRVAKEYEYELKITYCDNFPQQNSK